MSNYQKKFDDLPVWQSSAELYDRVDDFIDRAPPRLRAGFRVKLEQAALSIAHNIAEAQVRPGKEAIAFLDAGHVSAAEVQSLAAIAARQPYLKEFTNELGEIRKLGESCSRQLWGWSEAKQNPQNRNGPPQQYQRRAPKEHDERDGAPPERAAPNSAPARGRY